MNSAENYRLCVAPMLDWTDKHCRYFHRLLAPNARLYTEMITTGALIHGDRARHLDFDQAEHPVALQLGGSEIKDLVLATQLAQQWGYDEVNLNCGCPSERVQRGAFGACLMKEADLVADCIKAMQDVSSVPITVKHRIGLDYDESYDLVAEFVRKIYDTGCRVFIVHARNAVLKGLSPKENRDVPPLRYDVVRRLKQDFSDAIIILNGGLSSLEMVRDEFERESGLLDGVMIGRKAYQDPRFLSHIHQLLWSDCVLLSDQEVISSMQIYMSEQLQKGVPIRAITRHMLGLVNGRKGARHWRRELSSPQRLMTNAPTLLTQVWHEMNSD